MNQIRVVIADDHAVVRSGLRLLLESQPDISVVGEAMDAAQAVHKTKELLPDVLLLDVSMPGGSGLHVIGTVSREHPQVKVLVLTMHDDPDYVRSALSAGGSGFILKRSADSELLSAIRAVVSGERYIDVSLRESVGADPARPSSGDDAAGTAPGVHLSPREREVLGLLARGHTNQEISDTIFVSVKTVETYRARLTQKLGLRGRAEIVRYAMEEGILKEDPGKPY